MTTLTCSDVIKLALTTSSTFYFLSKLLINSRGVATTVIHLVYFHNSNESNNNRDRWHGNADTM